MGDPRQPLVTMAQLVALKTLTTEQLACTERLLKHNCIRELKVSHEIQAKCLNTIAF